MRWRAYPTCCCKLSGAHTTPALASGLRRYYQTVLEEFGAYWLMFGTDWPVSLGASYGQACDLYRELTADLSPWNVTRSSTAPSAASTNCRRDRGRLAGAAPSARTGPPAGPLTWPLADGTRTHRWPRPLVYGGGNRL